MLNNHNSKYYKNLIYIRGRALLINKNNKVGKYEY